MSNRLAIHQGTHTDVIEVDRARGGQTSTQYPIAPRRVSHHPDDDGLALAAAHHVQFAAAQHAGVPDVLDPAHGLSFGFRWLLATRFALPGNTRLGRGAFEIGSVPWGTARIAHSGYSPLLARGVAVAKRHPPFESHERQSAQYAWRAPRARHLRRRAAAHLSVPDPFTVRPRRSCYGVAPWPFEAFKSRGEAPEGDIAARKRWSDGCGAWPGTGTPQSSFS